MECVFQVRAPSSFRAKIALYALRVERAFLESLLPIL